MENIAWRTLGGGFMLEVYKVDPVTRQMTLLIALRRTKPMSTEEAIKYVNDNYPKNGSAVQAAAEILGKVQKR